MWSRRAANRELWMGVCVTWEDKNGATGTIIRERIHRSLDARELARRRVTRTDDDGTGGR